MIVYRIVSMFNNRLFGSELFQAQKTEKCDSSWYSGKQKKTLVVNQLYMKFEGLKTEGRKKSIFVFDGFLYRQHQVT